MKLTVNIKSAFPPQLVEASTVLRYGSLSLHAFLSYHPNPCLSKPAHQLMFGDKKNTPDYRDAIRENNGHTSPAVLQQAVNQLIDYLDDEGFLDLPENTDEVLGTPHLLESAVQHLQSIAPQGVGARSSEEFLLLQLCAMPNSAAVHAAKNLINQHWHYLKRKRWDKLPKKNLAAALKLIETLRLKPITADATAPFLIPDVLIKKVRGLWKAQADSGGNIVPHYQAQADSTYLERQQAKRIVQAVRARHRWILRLATFIANQQSAFFEHGPSHLKTLTMQSAADHFGVSVGMISHVVAEKVLSCPHGTFLFKEMFPLSVHGGAVLDKIATLIKNENPHTPLSDKQIQHHLQQMGYTLSLRTVCKYRQKKNLLAAHLRKRP